MRRLCLTALAGLAAGFPALAQTVDAAPAPVWTERHPAMMPPEAVRSGYCCLDLLSDGGGGVTVEGLSCSEDIFAQPSREAVSRWRLDPDTPGSRAAEAEPFRQMMWFLLTDMRGACLPDPDGWLCDGEDFIKRTAEEVCHGNLVG